MENSDSHTTNETNEVEHLRDEIKKLKDYLADMRNETIRLEARMNDMEETVREYEARMKDMEEMLRKNVDRLPKLPRITFLWESKPKPELCIYGNTNRESEFVRVFKKLEEKAFTFIDRDDLRNLVPIVLVCECTQDRHINDLNRCLDIITESDRNRTTIIYIREVVSSQQLIDQFTTRDRIRMTEERDKYKELDYRILDMLYTKNDILACEANDEARRRIKTFVKEYTAKVEKYRKKNMTV